MIKRNKNRAFLILLSLLLTSGWFYWFQWRPSELIKKCHQTRLDEIEKRHEENLNYYYIPLTDITINGYETDTSIGENLPMRTKDRNARLDVYWGDIAFDNCLNSQGLKK